MNVTTKDSRIYVVYEGENVRLVDARSQAAALAHVTRPKYRVQIAMPREIAKHMAAGVKVETVGGAE